jgi:hypothetical protein
VTTRLLASPSEHLEPQWEDVVELSLVAPGPMVATELVNNDPTVHRKTLTHHQVGQPGWTSHLADLLSDA